MAKKLLLGLAVVGGGVYYYDRNVSPIFPRDSKGQPVAITNAKPSKEVRKEFSKLQEDSKDFGSQLKKTVNESVADVRQKTDSTVSSIKDSDMYNKWSKKLDSYLKDVQTAAEEIENKPLGNRLAAKYIRFVNSIGQTEDDKLKELASSTSSKQRELEKDLNKSKQSWSSWWSGKKSEAEDKKDELATEAKRKKNSWIYWGEQKKSEAEDKTDELTADAKKKKNSWISWGELKKDEAKQEKDSWVSWGEKKSDEAKKAAKDAKTDAESEKNKWVSWGSSKADEAEKAAKDASSDWKSTLEDSKKLLSSNLEAGKQKAIEEYNYAKKNLEDLTKQAQDRANGLWGKADEDHLQNAKNDFQSAFTNLKRYGSELVDGK